ncbi:MAG: helix-turn-helix domain-containing protein [Ruminococcus flavefaciens]|nr:helix-turn-helix domain-containing protein [Ruminococcus flavefaciens]MCM1363189.1 helix-turn-helix domain-containing protein [Clostridiales bacterium]
MTLGERIKLERKKKGITQKQLAEKINKGFSTVQKYEIDVITPPLDMIQKIADALEISVMDLMPDTDKATVFKQKQKKNGKKIDEMNLEELTEVTETLDFLDTITSLNQTSQQLKERDAHIRAAISERRKVLEAFDTLNSLGKEKALERVEELTEIPKYTIPDSDNNNDSE